MAQREERTHRDDSDGCWSPLGAGSRIRSSQAHFALSPEVIVRAVLGAQETEDTCREGESPGLLEALPLPATSDTPLVRKVDEGDSLDPGDNVADPLLDPRAMACVRPSYLSVVLQI